MIQSEVGKSATKFCFTTMILIQNQHCELYFLPKSRRANNKSYVAAFDLYTLAQNT